MKTHIVAKVNEQIGFAIFSKDDPDIFDTEEEAIKVIRQTKRKKNLIFASYLLFMAFIAVIIVIFKILTGTF